MSGIKSTCKFEKNYKYNIQFLEKLQAMELIRLKNSNLGSFFYKIKRFFSSVHITFPVPFSVMKFMSWNTGMRRKTEISEC